MHLEVSSEWEGWEGVEPAGSSDVAEALALTPPRRAASSAAVARGGAGRSPAGGPAPSPRPRRAAALANPLLKGGSRCPAGSTDYSGGSGDGSNQTHDGDAGRERGGRGGQAVVSPGVYRTRSAAAAVASEAEAAGAAARRAAMRRTVSHIERGTYALHLDGRQQGQLAGLEQCYQPTSPRSASPSDEEHQWEYGQALRPDPLDLGSPLGAAAAYGGVPLSLGQQGLDTTGLFDSNILQEASGGRQAGGACTGSTQVLRTYPAPTRPVTHLTLFCYPAPCPPPCRPSARATGLRTAAAAYWATSRRTQQPHTPHRCHRRRPRWCRRQRHCRG